MNFDDWWANDPLPGNTVGKGGIRACCVKAWNAALEAAARGAVPGGDTCRPADVADAIRDLRADDEYAQNCSTERSQ